MVSWFCKGCGSEHKLDDSSGSIQLALEGIPVAGSLTCENCMTRHEISDVVSGKFAQPRQSRKPRTDADALQEEWVLPSPTFRPALGALGFLIMAAEVVILFVWSAYGDSYVPYWYVSQFANQGLTLACLRVVVLLMICFGLTSTHHFRPQLWYLAGIVAFLLAIRVLAYWFLGDETLAGGATGISDRLVVFFLYIVRWLPLVPIWIFLLAIGGLQLREELGKPVSYLIFYSGLLHTFTVLVFYFDIPLSLFTDFPVARLSLIVCQLSCAIGLYWLSRRSSGSL